MDINTVKTIQIKYSIRKHLTISVPYSNKNHPELREGEAWITNTEDISNVDWKTKRYGMIAYDSDGNIINHLFPVFAQRFEVENGTGRKYE